MAHLAKPCVRPSRSTWAVTAARGASNPAGELLEASSHPFGVDREQLPARQLEGSSTPCRRPDVPLQHLGGRCFKTSSRCARPRRARGAFRHHLSRRLRLDRASSSIDWRATRAEPADRRRLGFGRAAPNLRVWDS